MVPVDQPRAHAPRQRHDDAGDGGAGPLPAPAAAAAPAADGLRHLLADRPRRSWSTTSACCPGSSRATRRQRLRLVSVGDASPRPLSAKLLARPRLLRQIRELIPDPSLSHLIPYNTTELERDVALSLGIPMYGADPRLAPLGSKTGCRRLFDEVGVPAPARGRGPAHARRPRRRRRAACAQRRPDLGEVIVKINEGVSGSGNALVDLRGLPAPGDDAEARRGRARGCGPCSPRRRTLSVDDFLAGFAPPRRDRRGAHHRR